MGDYDGDGRLDVFTTGVGHNHLYRNEGGTFRDVTERAGVRGAADQWTTSAGFFDYDRDGDLDLFVCNYLVITSYSIHYTKLYEPLVESLRSCLRKSGRCRACPVTK